MAIFTSGIPINFLGYKMLHRPLRITGTVDTLEAAIKSNPNLPYYNDPRGLFVEGMIPSRQISYRIFHQVAQGFTSGGEDVARSAQKLSAYGGAAGLVILGFALPEFVSVTVKTRTAIVAFEGRDVIDLPTEGLEKDGNALILPDKIYRVYHAGEKPLITPDSSVFLNTTVAFSSNTKDNMARGVKFTDDIPWDALFDIGSRTGKTFVDTGSNRAIVEGEPSYISYTAVDRPLFRDVLVAKASGTGFGIVNASTGFIMTSTAGGETGFHLLRFAYVTDTKIKEKEVPKTRWRLIESYGISPISDKKTFETPKDLVSSLDEKSKVKNDLASAGKHYVYDLNESQDLIEVMENFDCTPKKNGYSPALATAKMDQNSRYYDEKFSGISLDYALGYASGTGLMTLHTVTAGFANTALVPSYSYTSPSLLVPIGKNGRLGLEYMTAQYQGILQDTVILASTREASPGVGVAYDECVNVANVVDTYETESGNVLVERFVDDISWTKSKQSAGESVLKRFLLGEFPLRSDGKAIFVPGYKELEISDYEKNIKIPSEYLATAILIKGDKNQKDTFVLYESTESQGQAIFESATAGTISLSSEQKIYIGIPPTKFSSSKSGSGLALAKIFGAKIDSVILPELTGNVQTKDPSSLQISKLGEQKFPVKASNPSMCSDCMRGWSYLAFENEGRTDIAFKRFYSSNWVMVRDVVLRIPDDFEEKDFDPKDPEFPPATLPLVVNDYVTGDFILFYLYKNKLLAKKIPNEITFSELLGKSDVLPADSETNIITKLHNLASVMVYDGGGEEESDSLALDIKLGKVKSFTDKTANKSKNFPVVQYSCCLDTSGYIYAFIQIKEQITIRSSSDLGETWKDVVSGDFRFLPPSTEIKKDTSASGTESTLDPEEAPSCLHDSISNNILVFFFSKGSLMVSKIPSEILRSQDAGPKLSAIKPRMLLGEMTKDYASRGIMPSKSVLGQGDTPPQLTPHRVAAYVTTDGYYRVFYKDEKRKLKSLVSFDTGDTWFTEEQFINKVAG